MELLTHREPLGMVNREDHPKTLRNLYRAMLGLVNFGCAKAPRIDDRKWGCIGLIITQLRSLILGSFRCGRNASNLIVRGISNLSFAAPSNVRDCLEIGRRSMIATVALFYAFSPLHSAELPVNLPQTADWISFAGGIYDLMRARYRRVEFEIEYKFHLHFLSSPFKMLEFLPLAGIMMNAQGAGYLYGGINFDFLFFKHLVFAPGFAAGYYWKGRGKNLGCPLEFRSGIELGWQFSDFRRLGVHFYHLSNASLGYKNPGEESFVFYFDVPIANGFPFSNYTAHR